MTDLFAITEAALRADRGKLDSISQNVANANTQAYKRELYVEAPFDRQLIQAQQGAGRVANEVRDLSHGPLRQTGSPLHFAIEGDGWFQLQSPHGVLLTRDGSFQLDKQGRLVSAQGWPVVLASEAYFMSNAPTLKQNGELWSDGVLGGQLSLASADRATLQVAGPNLFRSSSAVALDAASTHVRQGFLEASNVNTLTEMVLLMQTMRGAEASQRAAHAYDEALEMAIATLGEY
jgi:flagellar basal-body rod protein FlgF